MTWLHVNVLLLHGCMVAAASSSVPFPGDNACSVALEAMCPQQEHTPTGVFKCDICAGQHQGALNTAHCTSKQVQRWCTASTRPATLPPPPERLAHFAWWHDVVAETHPFASFTFGTPDQPARSGAGALPMNASWLVHAHGTYAVQGMWNVESSFFAASAARHGYLALRPDWRTRWAAVSAAAVPLLRNGTIFGFFIGDELFPQHVTPAELRTAADAVRADFPSPSVISWVNFCACPPFGRQLPDGSWAPGAGFDIPPSLSWASVDVYDGLRASVWPSTPFVPRVQAAVKQLLLPKMLANQSLMLVPGSYATNLTTEASWCNLTCGDAKAARDAYDFYRWAVQDERVVGMAPWNWGGCGLCTSTKDEIGTVDLVESKAAWVAIGKAIARKA